MATAAAAAAPAGALTAQTLLLAAWARVTISCLRGREMHGATRFTAVSAVAVAHGPPPWPGVSVRCRSILSPGSPSFAMPTTGE